MTTMTSTKTGRMIFGHRTNNKKKTILASRPRGVASSLALFRLPLFPFRSTMHTHLQENVDTYIRPLRHGNLNTATKKKKKPRDGNWKVGSAGTSFPSPQNRCPGRITRQPCAGKRKKYKKITKFISIYLASVSIDPTQHEFCFLVF